MTDARPRSRAGDLAVPVTTAAVAAGAAAAVAWAAATPVHFAAAPSAPQAMAPVDHSAAIAATTQQIEALRASIATTRRLIHRVQSTRIPRVTAASTGAGVALPAMPSTTGRGTTAYVPPAAAPAPAPPPATHTTTGASGAPH